MQDEWKVEIREGRAWPTDPLGYRPPVGGDATARDLFLTAVKNQSPDIFLAIHIDLTPS
jgi:hypothetical protein